MTFRKQNSSQGKNTKYAANGEWAKKGNKSYFRYKMHIKTVHRPPINKKNHTTATKIHDSKNRPIWRI
jgi:IS5 family transposase